MRLFAPEITRSATGLQLTGGWREGVVYGLAVQLVGGVAAAVFAAATWPDGAGFAVFVVACTTLFAGLLVPLLAQPYLRIDGATVTYRRLALASPGFRYDAYDLRTVDTIRRSGRLIHIDGAALDVGDHGAEVLAELERIHSGLLEQALARAAADAREVPATLEYAGDGVSRPSAATRLASAAAFAGAAGFLAYAVFVAPRFPGLDHPDLLPGSVTWVVLTTGWGALIVAAVGQREVPQRASLQDGLLEVHDGSTVHRVRLAEVRSARTDRGVVVALRSGGVVRFGGGWPDAVCRDWATAIARGALSSDAR